MAVLLMPPPRFIDARVWILDWRSTPAVMSAPTSRISSSVQRGKRQDAKHTDTTPWNHRQDLPAHLLSTGCTAAESTRLTDCYVVTWLASKSRGPVEHNRIFTLHLQRLIQL